MSTPKERRRKRARWSRREAARIIGAASVRDEGREAEARALFAKIFMRMPAEWGFREFDDPARRIRTDDDKRREDGYGSTGVK